MSTNDQSNNYNKTNIASMELIYGEGYLSAGGDAEIEKICADVDIVDKTILDLGCGLGGATVALAKFHNAAHVTGADTNQDVLSRAKELVQQYKLEEKTTLTLIDPGPLPFPDHHFDIIHVTAVACHIESLTPFFTEIFRVLKPNGHLLGRDWFKRAEEDNPEYTTWDNMLRSKGLIFHFVNEATFTNALEESGFNQITLTDRTNDIAKLAQHEIIRVAGPLKNKLMDVLGAEGYEQCQQWTKIRHQALQNGGIGQSQFNAIKL